ncbi:MAG: non-hydrolyzing UDP-N-acetylglucosamine 2-epimerase [Desulfomicrobium sp.]
MKIINVVGARPNFMKIAPIIDALNDQGQVVHLLVHTGQHYDQRMSQAFFEDLGLPRPDIDLEVGSGSHAQQTAAVMVEFEKVLLREKPDWVVVVGDVNSTLACALTAKKLGIKVAHVEAGLRSRDMSMPEEINRLCTDAISDALFTTDCFADENLAREGVPARKVHFVGNVMIDTLLKHRDRARELGTYSRFGLEPGMYVAMTMHRPGNVDNRETLEGILMALERVSRDIPILFPIHPRTAKMIERFGLSGYVLPHGGDGVKPRFGVWTTEPLGYLDFLNVNMHSRMVLTDSGGLQEETSVLGVPCVTMRPNTERPVTCEMGTNVLVGNDPAKIEEAVRARLVFKPRECATPPLWDGRAGARIVAKLMELGGS